MRKRTWKFHDAKCHFKLVSSTIKLKLPSIFKLLVSLAFVLVQIHPHPQPLLFKTSVAIVAIVAYERSRLTEAQKTKPVRRESLKQSFISPQQKSNKSFHVLNVRSPEFSSPTLVDQHRQRIGENIFNINRLEYINRITNKFLSETPH